MEQRFELPAAARELLHARLGPRFHRLAHLLVAPLGLRMGLPQPRLRQAQAHLLGEQREPLRVFTRPDRGRREAEGDGAEHEAPVHDRRHREHGFRLAPVGGEDLDQRRLLSRGPAQHGDGRRGRRERIRPV